MAGIAKKQGFQAMMIGGVRDHIHALIVIPPTLPLAKAVQYSKGSSSKWINQAGTPFAWQEGAFSVSASQTQDVVRYIQNQRAHHARRSFEHEFLGLLEKYGVSYDSQYVLG